MLHGDRAHQRPPSVVGCWPRRAEHCHYRVPSELVNDSTMGRDHLDHGRQVSTDHLCHLSRRRPFGQRGKPADVGEHDGGFHFLLKGQCGRRGLHQVGDFRRKEGRQRPGKQCPFLHSLEPKPQSGLGCQVCNELVTGGGERLGWRRGDCQRSQ